MQMFLASCSQMKCHYLGLVSDLLFSAHLLDWVTERPACRRALDCSLCLCCLLTSPQNLGSCDPEHADAVDRSFTTQWSETWGLNGDYKQTQ